MIISSISKCGECCYSCRVFYEFDRCVGVFEMAEPHEVAYILLTGKMPNGDSITEFDKKNMLNILWCKDIEDVKKKYSHIDMSDDKDSLNDENYDSEDDGDDYL